MTPVHPDPNPDPIDVSSWPDAATWSAILAPLHAPDHLTADLARRLGAAGLAERERVATAASGLAGLLVRPGEPLARTGEVAATLAAWRARWAHPDQLGHGVTPLAALALQLPAVLGEWRAWGIEAEIIDATCDDLGRQVHLHERVYGEAGCENFHWVANGIFLPMFVLGRLQWALEQSDATVAGYPPEVRQPGGAVLACHIPESGPLEVAAVDQSVALAAEFFPRVFGASPCYATCFSWLLNPLLISRLPGTNLAEFARRWTLCGDPVEATHDAVYFAFRVRPPYDVETLESRSRLHDLVMECARSDGWAARNGYFLLSD
ncbi:DUF5596 domain-containing protein [Micrococcales bacterium 31B]|nr:DUF5596 domain-containing protein [Micrococcales bacterium 31B]